MPMTALHAAIGVLALLVLGLSDSAGAACDEPAALAAARLAVSAACPCDVADAGIYRRCVAGVVRTLALAGRLPNACARAVRKCAARSTCGRPGAVTCCKTSASGATRCTISTATRCAAMGGCAGQSGSCCDTCGTPGCTTTTIPAPTTTTTSTTTTTTSTTTTTLATVCGNGVIEGSEWCDGDELCSPQCTIVRVACCEVAGAGDEVCSSNVPALTLLSFQSQVCPPTLGATFKMGLIAASGGPCPLPPTIPGTQAGACTAPAELSAPASVCCQDTATSCLDVTTANVTEISNFVWICLYSHYPNAPVVAGTCTAEGRCQPAH